MGGVPICECATFWENHHDECPVRREIESLRSTISRLREYAWHKASCSRFPDLPFDCDCGYDELMAELEESK